uniref:Uncharacterized protein n=1 Tax=Rhizophora mucronata TaxID=61149 RepID=A0A2P2IN28_RHIMU
MSLKLGSLFTRTSHLHALVYLNFCNDVIFEYLHI